MDYERPPPHNRTTSSSSNSASSELFICFTSRLSSSSSSSSMKISSKSILSPGRTDKQISLSASLSRRLRNNGSIKGGQSPMFPTGAKKRGSGFENTEPTSPKVTCIGQVRVKTKKKQAMKMRSMSKRRGSSGEASFRRIEQKQLDQNHHHHQHQQHSGYLQQQLQQSQSQHQQQQQDGLQQRNQKWVHLPLTICEALRAFGAEFNCFLPCRSSCMSSSERDQKEKMNHHGSSSIDDGDQNSTRSCGAVFARWLVALQEGEGKTREIELVVGGEEEEEEEEEGTERRSYHRRHVMEDIDINEVEKCNAEKIGVMEEGGEGEQGRVSICVPPKNALLLMRCRSDPLRMAALANRFWESPVTKDDEDFEDIKDEDDEEETEHGNEQEEDVEKEESLEVVLETEHEVIDKFEELVVHEADEEECGVSEETTNLVIMEVNGEEDTQESIHEINHSQEEIAEIQEEEEDKEEDDEVKAAELMSDSSPKALVDPESQEIEVIEAELVQEKEENDGEFEEDEERRVSLHSSVSPLSIQSEKEEEEESHEMEAVAESETTMVRPLEEEEEEETEKSTMEKETTQSPSSEETTVTHQRSEPETHENHKEEEEEEEEAELERESHQQQQPTNLVRESRSTTTLPDCLLLMMCEPKLSMEVSKETWVCSTDFIRCVPSTAEKKKVIKTDGRDHQPKRRVSIDSHPGVATRKKVLLQPPRSSCSFPTAVAAAASAAAQGVSMATLIEQKLGNSVAYEPFVLKRCKSEPMRNAAKFAQPEACFWKNRKLEPHHRGAAVGVGAAGIGF